MQNPPGQTYENPGSIPPIFGEVFRMGQQRVRFENVQVRVRRVAQPHFIYCMSGVLSSESMRAHGKQIAIELPHPFEFCSRIARALHERGRLLTPMFLLRPCRYSDDPIIDDSGEIGGAAAFTKPRAHERHAEWRAVFPVLAESDNETINLTAPGLRKLFRVVNPAR